jgi:hypothetical protein
VTERVIAKPIFNVSYHLTKMLFWLGDEQSIDQIADRRQQSFLFAEAAVTFRTEKPAIDTFGTKLRPAESSKGPKGSG